MRGIIEHVLTPLREQARNLKAELGKAEGLEKFDIDIDLARTESAVKQMMLWSDKFEDIAITANEIVRKPVITSLVKPILEKGAAERASMQALSRYYTETGKSAELFQRKLSMAYNQWSRLATLEGEKRAELDQKRRQLGEKKGAFGGAAFEERERLEKEMTNLERAIADLEASINADAPAIKKAAEAAWEALQNAFAPVQALRMGPLKVRGAMAMIQARAGMFGEQARLKETEMTTSMARGLAGLGGVGQQRVLQRTLARGRAEIKRDEEREAALAQRAKVRTDAEKAMAGKSAEEQREIADQTIRQLGVLYETIEKRMNGIDALERQRLLEIDINQELAVRQQHLQRIQTVGGVIQSWIPGSGGIFSKVAESVSSLASVFGIEAGGMMSPMFAKVTAGIGIVGRLVDWLVGSNEDAVKKNTRALQENTSALRGMQVGVFHAPTTFAMPAQNRGDIVQSAPRAINVQLDAGQTEDFLSGKPVAAMAAEHRSSMERSGYRARLVG